MNFRNIYSKKFTRRKIIKAESDNVIKYLNDLEKRLKHLGWLFGVIAVVYPYIFTSLFSKAKFHGKLISNNPDILICTDLITLTLYSISFALTISSNESLKKLTNSVITPMDKAIFYIYLLSLIILATMKSLIYASKGIVISIVLVYLIVSIIPFFIFIIAKFSSELYLKENIKKHDL